MYRKPEVCILPVAGLSTRNLPATKVLHKGFLTLNNLPIIQYAVNTCAEIGVKDIVFIYSDNFCKEMFARYFSKNAALEQNLAEKGKLDLLETVRKIIPDGMNFHFAEQTEPKGNGHAVLMAKDVIGKRDFIVMWPDDVYISHKGGKGILHQLLDVYEQEGGMVENIMEFPREQMVRYGALIGAVRDGRIVHAKGKIEKPELDKVPSNYASMGPYILPNEIMDILPEVCKGTNGEINLADAMGLAAERGIKLTGVLCDVLRFDCGTNKDLAKANLMLTLMENPELRTFCSQFLNTIVA